MNRFRSLNSLPLSHQTGLNWTKSNQCFGFLSLQCCRKPNWQLGKNEGLTRFLKPKKWQLRNGGCLKEQWNKYLNFGWNPAKADAQETPSTQEGIFPQQVTHCCIGYYYGVMPQNSAVVARVRRKACCSSWQSSCLKLKEQKFSGKGHLGGVISLKCTACLIQRCFWWRYTCYSHCQTLAGAFLPPATLALHSHLFCSPQAVVSTLLFQFSLPPFTSCIFINHSQGMKCSCCMALRDCLGNKPTRRCEKAPEVIMAGMEVQRYCSLCLHFCRKMGWILPRV